MPHTPGPWTNSPHSNEIMALDNGNCLVLRAKAYGRTGEEIDANATLIAAAPDMRAELERAAERIRKVAEYTHRSGQDEVTEMLDPIVQSMEAVAAKATEGGKDNE